MMQDFAAYLVECFAGFQETVLPVILLRPPIYCPASDLRQLPLFRPTSELLVYQCIEVLYVRISETWIYGCREGVL